MRNTNPNNARTPKSINIPNEPNALDSPNPTLSKSKKYVNGDIKVSALILIAINKGLIKIKGNFITMVRIIVFAGISVGGTDRIKLKDENENAATNTLGRISNGFTEVHNPKMNNPNNNGTVEKITPKINELHTFPSKMVLIEIGQVINRSNVFWRVSQGNITGPIDVLERKRTIPINPDIIYTGIMLLPTVNAKKSMIGKRTPCITTGPLL